MYRLTRKMAVFFMFVFALLNVNGQEYDTSITIILVVNGEVVSKPLDVNILNWSEGRKDELAASYWPGKLSLMKADYLKLTDKKFDSSFLNIDNKSYSIGKFNSSYKIKLSEKLLHQYFIIFYIYDLAEKKYHNLFSNTKKNETYVYEMTSSAGQRLLIRK